MADTLGPRMGKVKRTLGELLGARRVDRKNKEWRQALDKADGVGEARVGLEGRLVLPARVDVEEPWIARGAEGVNAEAAWLATRRRHDIAKGVDHCLLLTEPRVKSREDVQLHASLLSSRPRQVDPLRTPC